MSNQRQVKHMPAETGLQYWGPGDKVTFLVTGEESGGACFIIQITTPPGGGPPPHIHLHEEESFYLFEGTLLIQAGGRTFRASPGDFVHIPRGTVHSFRNDGNVDAKFLVTCSPAGGLENFFRESFFPAQDRTAPPSFDIEELKRRMMVAAPRNGIEFVAPVGRSS